MGTLTTRRDAVNTEPGACTMLRAPLGTVSVNVPPARIAPARLRSKPALPVRSDARLKFPATSEAPSVSTRLFVEDAFNSALPPDCRFSVVPPTAPAVCTMPLVPARRSTPVVIGSVEASEPRTSPASWMPPAAAGLTAPATSS